MNQAQRARVLRWATILLTFGAFANSYRHGVQWAIRHSPEDQEEFWAWAIAALPEVMVLIAVLLAMDRLSDPRVWVIGGTGVGWTLWANGAAAAGGLSGLVVALAPAWSALLALWSMDHSEPEPAGVDQPEPAHEVAQTAPMDPGPRVHEQGPPPGMDPGPRVQESGPRTAPKGPRTARSRGPRVAGPSKTDRATRWAMDQPAWPTARQIMDQFPDLSRTTAKRVKPPVDHFGMDGMGGELDRELSLSS